ncbi:MAG: 16S rRNA (guanine(966)-N(2))-methyltransferase RsmD [Bdellovibrionales bacterium RIFCSPHIGHO2_01_FULL_40_29]|nr:MAG: 16S rRNA (guanine(966)-N(2))-methyltransferase RsmD [Bdellovibrionales bacterium RIFCSPHIGHO2_01_FULL_40_29]OFZ34070.1 MAG: 16S rRNA (guanine(966)-N(2))-methyltransferase RsmD [Bdellovibrionales bacterium RIFCSPHIGHO2_02_FULL_40_15]
MRVIAGKYKGRVLTSFQASHIRPTMDRVKETLFNKWMHDVDEARVLDLFAGTGSLGIEALSRGAHHVDFVEKNPQSLQIISKNLEALKVLREEYSIQKKDVLAFLSQFSGQPYNLILIDPPFTEKMAHDVMLALDSSSCFDQGTLIAIESLKQERIDAEYPRLVRYDFKDYGDKILSFYRKKEQS